MSSRGQYAIYSARRHSFVLKRKKKRNHQCWESKLDHSPHQIQMLTKSRTVLHLARILDQEQILQLTNSSIKIGPWYTRHMITLFSKGSYGPHEKEKKFSIFEINSIDYIPFWWKLVASYRRSHAPGKWSKQFRITQPLFRSPSLLIPPIPTSSKRMVRSSSRCSKDSTTADKFGM